MELRRNIHHVFRLAPLCIDTPKYHHKVFAEPYRSTLKVIIAKVVYDYDIELVELDVPKGHIHMVVRAEPKVVPSDVM